MYLIKASVKSDRIYVDTTPQDLGTLDANGGRLIDNFLTAVGKIYPYVFKAILIAAAVKNSVRIYCNAFPAYTRILRSV